MCTSGYAIGPFSSERTDRVYCYPTLQSCQFLLRSHNRYFYNDEKNVWLCYCLFEQYTSVVGLVYAARRLSVSIEIVSYVDHRKTSKDYPPSFIPLPISMKTCLSLVTCTSFSVISVGFTFLCVCVFICVCV